MNLKAKVYWDYFETNFKTLRVKMKLVKIHGVFGITIYIKPNLKRIIEESVFMNEQGSQL